MQYTPHYNLNLPEGTDIVNPLVQDNPNYTAIDTAMYANKLRVVGTATELTTGTVHALTRSDTDIDAFKFVATSDYIFGDTFTVDGIAVTATQADGTSLKNHAYVINSTVLAILNGTKLQIINAVGASDASGIAYDNSTSGLSATNVQTAVDEIDTILDGSASGISINSAYVTAVAGVYQKYSKVGHIHNISGMITTVQAVPFQTTMVYPGLASDMPSDVMALVLTSDAGNNYKFGWSASMGLYSDDVIPANENIRFNITWYR